MNLQTIQTKLEKLYKQKEQIEEEIAQLEQQLEKPRDFSKNEKIEIFKSLFIARDDIYAKKWVSKDGQKQGFYPVTTTFRGEDYIPLSHLEIEQHLRGTVQLATYTISQNNQSKFTLLQILEEDIVKLHLVLQKHAISASYELNSTKDIFVWIFFETAIPSGLAKAFGHVLSNEAQINSKVFPNQDFANASSLGGLVELPLHLKYRNENKTVFIDIQNHQPYIDQWHYLSRIKKVTLSQVQKLSKHDNTCQQSWNKNIFENIEYPTFKLKLVLYDDLYIPTSHCSKTFLNELKALATFDNPQIKTLLALRKPLFNTPRTIKNFEEDDVYLKLPRGLTQGILKLLKEKGVEFTIEDKRRESFHSFEKVQFTLREEQSLACEKIMQTDYSICVAPPGFGKTLIGAKMIELRGVNTLVVVNKNMLLDQWIERFVDYFKMNKKEIGYLGKGKNKLNNTLDVATMQSLKNRPELIKNYSFVIVDECHHIPAVTFEQIIKQFCGSYVLGLSATPNRKDGLEPILFQQLGSISYEHKKRRTLTHDLKIVYSGFVSQSDNYAQLINELSVNEERNKLILNEILQYKERKILVLTDRIEHINILEELLIKNNLKYVSIHGSLSKKEQKENIQKVQDHNLIIATTSFFGEGIDFPHLNTIVFATPISYYGRLVQYLGRVGREGQACLAIDILDNKHAMLNSAYKKRLEGYKQMHYKQIR